MKHENLVLSDELIKVFFFIISAEILEQIPVLSCHLT